MTCAIPPGSTLEKTTAMLKRLGFGRSTLAEIRTPGSKYHCPLFPAPIRLSALGAQFWIREEIDAWIAQTTARQLAPRQRGKKGALITKSAEAPTGQLDGTLEGSLEGQRQSDASESPQPPPMPSTLLVKRYGSTAADHIDSRFKGNSSK